MKLLCFSCYDLKFNDTIRVFTNKEDLVIECCGGNNLTMTVDPLKTTAADVMEFVRQKLHFPPERQCLTLKGKKLDAGATLQLAFAEGKPVIKLETAVHRVIKVKKPSGDFQNLKTHSFATTVELKNQMVSEGLCTSEAKLMFNGTSLESDEPESLTHYGIGQNSVIEIYEPQKSHSVHRGMSSGPRRYG